jgi:hypothetical protein
MTRQQSRRRRVRPPGVVLAGAAICALMPITTMTANAQADDRLVAGSQGVNTALPATASQLTVNGRGKFADLAITVNQTQELTNQAISVTWTGGVPTVSTPGTFAEHYLQIMQCWGDDDGTVPDNPGPPPEQCVQGAVGGTPGGLGGSLFPPGQQLGRIISRRGWENFDEVTSAVDEAVDPAGNVWRQFRSVTGKAIGAHADTNFNPALGGGDFWLNDLFNVVTTNEVAGSKTSPNGTGAELVQVLTGVQSSGLGCGQRVQAVAGGDPKIPKCWLVVVPRGSWQDENVGTPTEDEGNGVSPGVTTSPVAPTAWANRIAIPLEFNPVDSPCDISANSRRIAGNELSFGAVAKWQPALCAGGAIPPFVYAPVPDSNARRQLSQPTSGSPGLVAINRPLDEQAVDPKNPIVYAPLTAQGITIGFNVERLPRAIDVPEDEARALEPLAGVRVSELNLTPRLVAKLLTQSYRSQFPAGGTAPPDYPWLRANPRDLAEDPDFQKFNPEFTVIRSGDSRTFGGLQLPSGNSDAARYVWEWVLADPEAKAWLDGQPDAWGMSVNPYYSTNAATNPTGVAFAAPDSFPKSDPYCATFPPYGLDNRVEPSPICGTDYMPYRRSFLDAAAVTRAASTQAKIDQNPNAFTSAQAWSTEVPQLIGGRSILALTDTASARLFGLQVANLSRAGDNGDNRVFVAPDQAGLGAGIAALVPSATEGVLEVDPNVDAPSAYPLTTLTYAAIAPLNLDAAARADYATFLLYAATAGQEAGFSFGQLPPGYVPLPDAFRAQTVEAAARVATLEAPVDPVPPTTTPGPGGAGGTDTTGGSGGTGGESSSGSGGGSSTTGGSSGTGGGSASTGGSSGAGGTGSSGAAGTGSGTITGASPPLGASPPSTVSEDTVEPNGGAVLDGGGDQEGGTPDSGSDAEALGSPGATPTSPIGFGRYALPGLSLLALLAALVALQITKMPRRAVAARQALHPAPGPVLEPANGSVFAPVPTPAADFGQSIWQPIGEM